MTASLPVRPGCRVIIDNDWTGDPDGLVGLAHHLLSPSNEVVLVTSSRLAEPLVYPGSSPQDGARYAAEVVALCGRERLPRTAAGSDAWFGDGASSVAADAIVEVALGHDDPDLPLVVVCAGPLTNIAQAIAQAPEIVERFTLVWVGGTTIEGFEYNRDTDRSAADYVFGQPGLAVVQFPLEAYRQLACSVAELEWLLQHEGGALGRRLWQAFVELPLPPFIRLGGVWTLGDSCPLLVTALTTASSQGDVRAGDDAIASRTMMTSVDARLVISDFAARLRLAAAQRS